MGAAIVGTVRMASPGAGSKRLVDDGLDRPRAAPAFRAAAETTVNLLGVTWEIVCGAYGATDIMVAQDIAGTYNHENAQAFVMRA